MKDNTMKKNPIRNTNRPCTPGDAAFVNVDHEYTIKYCPECGRDFCYNCCGDTNIGHGGLHENPVMRCPTCGHNYFSKA